MAEAHILRIDSLPVIDRGNGIQTTPLVTKEIGSQHLATGITRFPVGAKVPMHSHNCEEQVTILDSLWSLHRREVEAETRPLEQLARDVRDVARRVVTPRHLLGQVLR